jgi:hypothetical protein
MKSHEKNPTDGGRFLSTDCVDFWLDGPGDHTVRPCRPELLEHAKAERAKIQGALAAQKETPDKTSQDN